MISEHFYVHNHSEARITNITLKTYFLKNEKIIYFVKFNHSLGSG